MVHLDESAIVSISALFSHVFAGSSHSIPMHQSRFSSPLNWGREQYCETMSRIWIIFSIQQYKCTRWHIFVHTHQPRPQPTYRSPSPTAPSSPNCPLKMHKIIHYILQLVCIYTYSICVITTHYTTQSGRVVYVTWK